MWFPRSFGDLLDYVYFMLVLVDIPHLWILESSTIGDVSVLISHIQHVNVAISWSRVVHQIFLFMEA